LSPLTVSPLHENSNAKSTAANKMKAFLFIVSPRLGSQVYGPTTGATTV
jgi:hypothetical protein